MVLDTGDHPALLKDAVTTPAGCTVDGLMELEEGKLRVTLIKAVVKATQRAKELAVHLKFFSILVSSDSLAQLEGAQPESSGVLPKSTWTSVAFCADVIESDQ